MQWHEVRASVPGCPGPGRPKRSGCGGARRNGGGRPKGRPRARPWPKRASGSLSRVRRQELRGHWSQKSGQSQKRKGSAEGFHR